MTYLILHIWLGLLTTFFLGLILGYLMGKNCKATCSQDTSSDETDSKDNAPVDENDIATSVDLDGESYAVETLEGIGKHTGQRFREAGISTVGDVLRGLRTPEQRQDFATMMGMKIDPINEWACQADILRVEGMDHQFAELVLLSGAPTVSELAKQNPKQFTKLMTKTNQSGRQLISPVDPQEAQVKDWIKKAKKLSPVLKI
ncbi:MAG: DUF4332 domain-containing protein [Bdellovibrionales bacterium]